MTAVKRPKPVHQMTIAQFEATFPDEEACRSYLVARRWPNGIHCPRCGNAKVYALASGYHWQCEACQLNGYRFSHIAGTIFENTNKPLREWFRVTHLMLTSKKGISALQIQRVMGFGSYGTAHSMCHKIRAALIEPKTKLGGIVEVDETFVSGKAKNRHYDKRDGKPGPTAFGKAIVAGVVRRKGNVIARVVDNVRASTLVLSSTKLYRKRSACSAPINGLATRVSTRPIRTPRLTMRSINTLLVQSIPKQLKVFGASFLEHL